LSGVPHEDFTMRVLTLDRLAVKVPDTFTWTLSFGGVPTNYFPGGLAVVSGPPVVGSFVQQVFGECEPNCSWGSPFSDSQLYAQVMARPGNAPPALVNPEPSTILLLGNRGHRVWYL
jgi:hypothetical protein